MGTDGRANNLGTERPGIGYEKTEVEGLFTLRMFIAENKSKIKELVRSLSILQINARNVVLLVINSRTVLIMVRTIYRLSPETMHLHIIHWK